MPNPNRISHALIASRILNTPLMLTQAKLDQILYIVGNRIGLDVSDLPPLQTQSSYTPNTVSKYPSYSLDDSGLAIIPINGSLVYKTSGFSGYSGMLSYRSIRDSFDDAMDNPAVTSILLDINSSGGEVSGVFDLVDHIYSSRGRKPIYAISDESAYSAAYAIASAADHIYLSRTAGVGSIGVIMLHVDRSEADAKAGLKYTHIYAGDHKTDGSPHKPLSDSAIATAQSTVNTIYDLFVTTVARNNGLSESDVRATQASTYNGRAAIDQGLANELLSYQGVITKLTKKGGITLMPLRTTTENPKPTITTTETPKPTITVTETPTVTPPTQPPSNPVTDPLLHGDGTPTVFTQSDITTAVTTERNRCIAIIEACNIANTPSISLDLICDGSTIETTHKMIMTVLAERSAATNINSAVNPAKSGSTNPLLANAKKRAEATVR